LCRRSWLTPSLPEDTSASWRLETLDIPGEPLARSMLLGLLLSGESGTGDEGLSRPSTVKVSSDSSSSTATSSAYTLRMPGWVKAWRSDPAHRRLLPLWGCSRALPTTAGTAAPARRQHLFRPRSTITLAVGYPPSQLSSYKQTEPRPSNYTPAVQPIVGLVLINYPPTPLTPVSSPLIGTQGDEFRMNR
jgi:hypothetical protein